MRSSDVERMYEEYASVVYKYLMSLCHDASLSEELTADTFERAVRNVNSFRGESTLAVWLCDGRPIFFLQNRAGKGSRPFRWPLVPSG